MKLLFYFLSLMYWSPDGVLNLALPHRAFDTTDPISVQHIRFKCTAIFSVADKAAVDDDLSSDTFIYILNASNVWLFLGLCDKIRDYQDGYLWTLLCVS